MVRFALLASLLSLASLAGCAAPSGALVLSYQGDADGQAAAELAVQEWVETCGADVSLGANGIPLSEVSEVSKADRGGETRTDGEARPQLIRFRSQGSIENTRAEIAHEIGHALGLSHTAPGVADLMAAEATTQRHVSAADCAALPR